MRRHDHLVPRPDSERPQRNVDRRRAGARGDAIRDAVPLGERHLEVADEAAGKLCQLAGAQRLGRRHGVLRAENGPGWERLAAGLRPTVDGEIGRAHGEEYRG